MWEGVEEEVWESEEDHSEKGVEEGVWEGEQDHDEEEGV